LDRDGSLSIDTDESLEHVFSWNSDFVHLQPSIIFAYVAEFRSHVSALDSFHPFVSFLISNLNYEWTNAIIVHVSIFGYLESCKDQSMVGISTHLSRPPFCSCISRSVDNELICVLVERCCSFKSCNVGSMTDLSLGVATYNI